MLTAVQGHVSFVWCCHFLTKVPRFYRKRKRKGRPWRKEVHNLVCQGRFAIPCRSYRSLPPSRKVRHPYGSRSPSIPCCRLGVLVRWDFGTCRKRCSWQQEVSYCAPSHHPCRQERRGIEQVARRSHHCCWRCLAQHPRRLVAQEEWQVSTLLSSNFYYKKWKPKKTTGDYNLHPFLQRTRRNWMNLFLYIVLV